MWSILADMTKAGNRWSQEDFFATGVLEIADVMRDIDAFTPGLERTRALDFGCGIGRLSQALALYFEEVVGVDIAPSMIERAAALNQASQTCRYVLNETDNLQTFGADYFTFVYSNIVLQHMPVASAKRYLREFARVLRPGGLLIFQLPESPPRTLPYLTYCTLNFLLPYTPRPIIDLFRRIKYRNVDAEFIRRLPRVVMEMNGMSNETVSETVDSANLKLLEIKYAGDLGGGWKSFRYVFQKA